MQKRKFLSRVVTGVVLMCFTAVSTACYGPFNLTRNVYHWNSGIKGSGKVNDKWMKEFVFFGMIVVPVYMFSALLDAFIFNPINLWSGDNPVKVTQDGKGHIREVQMGKITATVTWADNGESAHVVYARKGQVIKETTIEREGAQLRLRDQGGHVLYMTEEGEDGSLRFVGRDGRVADTVTPQQVQWRVEQFRVEPS